MTYRRRHSWLRRLVLGLAFAAFASPAAAKLDEGGGARYVTAGGWSGPVDPGTGVPLSAGIGAELAAGGPFHGEDAASKALAQSSFAGSERAGTSVAWDGGVTLAIGGIVLALGLAAGFGFLKRPRLAGL